MLKWKRECGCVYDPKIVQESVAVFLHTLRVNDWGTRKRAGMVKRKERAKL